MRIHSVIFLCYLLSTYLYALGLGEIQLHSYLNEPFSATIPFIDPETTDMSNTTVSIGSPEDYTTLDLPRESILTDLKINIIRNNKGKRLIQVQSMTRCQAPYFVLLINLTWPQGEVYRTYTVLLDPPHYGSQSTSQISSHALSMHYTIQKNALHSTPPTSTYGPTLINENVWQIAKRYKTAHLTLPQIVLGIVGENPEAFEADNLNGLKPAVLLHIPHHPEISLISKNLAAQEIEMHDIAWQAHTPIHHVLAPPYFTSTILISELPIFHLLSIDSKIPPAPLLLIQRFSLSETQLSLETKLKTLEETHQQLLQALRTKEHENQQLRIQIQALQQELIQLKQPRVTYPTHIIYVWLSLMIFGLLAGFIEWKRWRMLPTAPNQNTSSPSPIPLQGPFLSSPEDKPISHKNYKALQTLLDLAKTYLHAKHIKEAKQILEKVAQYGNKKQQKEANTLLSKIEG